MGERSAELVDRVATVVEALEARPRHGAGPRVVALDGRSGAGKTTLAGALAAALGGAPVVALEGLYGGWDGLRAGGARLVGDVLAPLAASGRASVPAYDWIAGRWGAPWVLSAPEVLLVDGVGCGTRAAAPFLALHVWLDLDEATRKRRALARDAGRYDPFWDRWAAQEQDYLRSEEPRARAQLRLG